MAVKTLFAAAIALAITIAQSFNLAHLLIHSKPYKMMAEPLPGHFEMLASMLPVIAIVASLIAVAAARRRIAFAPLFAAGLFPGISFLAVFAVVLFASPVGVRVDGDFGSIDAVTDFAKWSAITTIFGGLPAGLTTAILRSVFAPRALAAILVVFALAGCHRNAITCEDQLPPSVANDPAALRDLVVAIRLRPASPNYSCEEGTECHRCEMLMYAAMRQFAKIGSDAAAENAAALVLDARMEWDGGAALTLSDAVARIGPPVLPYLRPHIARSSMAERIIRCIENGEPCI